MKNIFIIISLSLLSAQMPFDCLFNKTLSLNRSSLSSNAIIDIRHGLENELYIGTSDGLGYADITDPLSPIFSMVSDSLLPDGGIPALKTYKLDDGNIMIVLSGATSSYIKSEGCVSSGTGISWSIDSGASWRHMPQSIAPPDSPTYLIEDWGDTTFEYLAVTTPVYNVSYDLDVQDSYIYSTSWAGGLRRFNYTIDNPEWEVIPLPMDNQDSLFCNNIDLSSYLLNPVDYDNQKAFSIYVESDTILWVGSAGGINKGVLEEDGCINWKNYNTDDGLGGFWVIGIIPQQYDSFTRTWLISWDSVPPSGHKLTYTDDGGETWEVVTQFENLDIVVYNLSFSNKNIIASTDHGLYKSDFDDGKFWISLPATEDINGERILTNNFYTAISISEGDIDTFLVGTEDGLSIVSTAGEILDNIRNWESPESFSAYPNPFFINEYNQVGNDKYVRLIYSNPNQFSGEIDIFDFAMDHVIQLNNFKPITIDENEIVWNGRNESGDKVANGAYFCRLSLNGKYYWTKLAVIN